MARQQRPQPEGAAPEQAFVHPHVVHGRFEHGDRLLRLRQVCEVVGLSRPSVYRLLAARAFPQPVLLGKVAKRWSAVELQQWLAQQLAGRAS